MKIWHKRGKYMFKSGFVTIIGRPNVGKSTLMNHFIGKKVAIMSNKPQTTRNRIQTILTTEKEQIIFIDTPGIHKPKHKLGEHMNQMALSTFSEVDALLWLVEPDQKVGAGDLFIIEKLKEIKTPVILVINKMDLIPKNEILLVMDAYRKLYAFDDIVPVSALKGENSEAVLDAVRKHLIEGPMFFPEGMVTDQPEKQLVAELIREKTLFFLKEEVPHGIAVVVESFEEREGQPILEIHATIVCEKKSHKPIILGKQGQMIKKIGTQARKDIQNLLGTKVHLELWVKVKDNWRDSEFHLKNYGYDQNQ
jgi:GTP-binding protein Era